MVSPAHPLANRRALRPEDLLDNDMIPLDLPHSSDYFMALVAGCGRRPRIVERTRDMPVQRGLLANGFGFGIANMRAATRCADDGRPLVFIPLDAPAPPLQLGVAVSRCRGLAHGACLARHPGLHRP